MHAISVALSIIPFPFVVGEMFRGGGGEGKGARSREDHLAETPFVRLWE